MTIDEQALREAAESVPKCGMVAGCEEPSHAWFHWGELVERFRDAMGAEETAAFVVAASPRRVLALLDELESARAAGTHYAEAVARIEALERNWVNVAHGIVDVTGEGHESGANLMLERARQLRAAIDGPSPHLTEEAPATTARPRVCRE